MLTCQYRKTALTIIIDISVEHFRSLKHSNTSFLSETGKCNSAFREIQKSNYPNPRQFKYQKKDLFSPCSEATMSIKLTVYPFV